MTRPRTLDVCLVVPPDADARLYRQLPLDVLYVAALLRGAGRTVAVWDMRVTPDAPDVAARVVGISTATSDRAQCYPLDLCPVRDAVSDCRASFPKAAVFLYGPHATHLPEDTLRCTGADAAARGELESAAFGAAMALLSGSCTELPRFDAVDLATLPIPAYDLVDMLDYRAEVVTRAGHVTSGPSALLLTVRGCPYRCRFCHLPFGSAGRTRPIELVERELEALSRRRVENLFVLDYVFGLQPGHYARLLPALRKHGMRWIAQSRPEVVVKRDVRDWARAGCTAVWLGAESDRVADSGVAKAITRELLADAVGRLRDAGIFPLFFVMVGLPDEAAGQAERLSRWLDEFGVGFVANVLTLRPGTDLFDQMGGRALTRWSEVEALNAAYLGRVPADPHGSLAALKRRPMYLGNLMSAGHELVAG
jgi:anaerobic magnesium-protoporphyrin IX monomethyl ester cyclase